MYIYVYIYTYIYMLVIMLVCQYSWLDPLPQDSMGEF